jgi:phage shock protein PspC (stress-responsive transcriptional regulator)
MTLSDELSKLQELHTRGTLSDAEFARAKARLLDGAVTAPALQAIGAMRRSRSDRWIAGVCGGLAAALGVEAWVLRLVATALLIWGGAGLVLYLLLWIFVPDE